jgi:hypothetical protein
MRFCGLCLHFRADAAPVRGPNLNDGKHKRRVARHPSIMRTNPAREYLDQRSDSEGALIVITILMINLTC